MKSVRLMVYLMVFTAVFGTAVSILALGGVGG